MPESHRQPAPGSRNADSRPSYWEEVGGLTAPARIMGAMLWEGIATDDRAVALTDVAGLPLPFLGRFIMRLANDRKRNSAEAMAVALRFAGLMRRHGEAKADERAEIDGNDIGHALPLSNFERAEVRAAWCHLLKRGACTLLADTDGHLLPDAGRRLTRMVLRHRQGDLFVGRPTTEGMLRRLAATPIRRRR